MKMLLPVEVTAEKLVASNVPETLPVHDAETVYALGDTVRDPASDLAYESLVEDNEAPLSDDANWLELGPTNRWKMFDRKLGTITMQPGTLDVTIRPGERVPGLALFGLAGSNVQVVMSDDADGEVYNQTFSLVSYTNVSSYYDYCFAPILRKSELFIDGLPLYANPAVRVVVDAGDGDAQCGNLVLGSVFDIGRTLLGAELGLIDASVKEADAFGNVDVVERAARGTANYTVEVDKDEFVEVGRLLTLRRAKPTVFVGDETYSSMLTYGFPRDWRLRANDYQKPSLSIQLESLS